MNEKATTQTLASCEKEEQSCVLGLVILDGQKT